MVEAKRTLVKSGPELWAELSDAANLGRHLEPFGAVRLVRADAETSVAWEGERARGEIRLEPSGFGTRVTLRADVADVEPAAPASPQVDPPAPDWTAAPARRPGLWARVLRRRRAGRADGVPQTASPPPRTPAPAPAPRPVPAMSPDAAQRVLTDVLDRLGRAHHRPFSRG